MPVCTCLSDGKQPIHTHTSHDLKHTSHDLTIQYSSLQSLVCDTCPTISSVCHLSTHLHFRFTIAHNRHTHYHRGELFSYWRRIHDFDIEMGFPCQYPVVTDRSCDSHMTPHYLQGSCVGIARCPPWLYDWPSVE